MDKIFKVNSIESNDITETQNLLNFEIPEGEVLDLSKSYMSVRVKTSAVITAGGAPAAATADAVFNTDLRFNHKSAADINRAHYVSPVALVRNAQMSSSNAGRVEELRDVNILRLNQRAFLQNEKEMMSEAVFGLMGCRDKEAFGHISPLIQASCEDQTGNQGTASKALEKEVRIPLKDILNIGKEDMVDTRRLGRCRLSCELDLSRMSASCNNNDIGFYNANNNGLIDDVAGAVDRTQLTLKKTYNIDYQEHLPFYVGMPVRAVPAADTPNGTGTIGALTAAQTAVLHNTISNIQHNPATGKVTLTFKNSWGNGAVANSFKIQPVADADITSSFVMNQAQLTLHALSKDKIPANLPKLEWSVYDLERDSAGGRQNFRKNYELLPEAYSMLVITPNGATGKLSNADYSDSRVSVNGELLTNRNLFVRTELQADRLLRYYENSGMQVKNLTAKQIENINGDGTATSFNNNGTGRGVLRDFKQITEPLPITQKMKMVEIELNASAADKLQDILIYTEKIKVL